MVERVGNPKPAQVKNGVWGKPGDLRFTVGQGKQVSLNEGDLGEQMLNSPQVTGGAAEDGHRLPLLNQQLRQI
jgi:hypothetical protein